MRRRDRDESEGEEYEDEEFKFENGCSAMWTTTDGEVTWTPTKTRAQQGNEHWPRGYKGFGRGYLGVARRHNASTRDFSNIGGWHFDVRMVLVRLGFLA